MVGRVGSNTGAKLLTTASGQVCKEHHENGFNVYSSTYQMYCTNQCLSVTLVAVGSSPAFLADTPNLQVTCNSIDTVTGTLTGKTISANSTCCNIDSEEVCYASMNTRKT